RRVVDRRRGSAAHSRSQKGIPWPANLTHCRVRQRQAPCTSLIAHSFPLYRIQFLISKLSAAQRKFREETITNFHTLSGRPAFRKCKSRAVKFSINYTHAGRAFQSDCRITRR